MSVFATASNSVVVTPNDTNYITAPQYKVSNDEAPITATSIDLSTDTITRNTHGLNNGDEVTVPNAGTTNLSTTALYYVRDSAANTFKLAASIGGAAVDITGAATTPPTVKVQRRLVTVRVVGRLYIGGTGAVAILPEGHPDTNTATEASNGAQIISGVPAGTVLPIRVKKVFSTGTTATNIKCLFY